MKRRSPAVRPKQSRRAGHGAVTLSDVATAAGVAPITVSRALNAPDTVSEALRERIGAAVAALGYVPNRMAGALASARTRVVPVIVPSLSNVVFVEVIAGIQETVEAAGYQILLGSTDYDLAREAALVATLLGWAPPGVLLAGLRHLPRTVELLRTAAVPVVEFMEYGPRCIDMNVGLSHVRAGAAMAAHLLEQTLSSAQMALAQYYEHGAMPVALRPDPVEAGLGAMKAGVAVPRGRGGDVAVLDAAIRADSGLGSGGGAGRSPGA